MIEGFTWSPRVAGHAFGAMLCTAVTLESALAESRPPQAPFAPVLVREADPRLCGAFLAATTDAFFGPEFRILPDRAWPGVEVMPVFTPRQEVRFDRTEGAGLRIATREADLDDDGAPELLALVAGSLGAGDVYRLGRFSADEAAALREGAMRIEAALQEKPERFEMGLDALGWSDWEVPTVLEIEGSIYFVGTGREWDDPESVFLARIPATGDAEAVCEVRVQPAAAAPLAGLAGSAVAEFYDRLGRMGGGYGNCGTLNTGRRRQLMVAQTRSRVALRPWALSPPGSEPYNSRAEVEGHLLRWSQNSLWNHRFYRGYAALEARAVAALAAYYRETFGRADEEADRQARVVMDAIIRAHFVFPREWPYVRWPQEVRPEERALKVLLLDGGPAEEVMRLLRDHPDLLRTPTALDENDEEPPLFFALEHPGLVTLLLEAGAAPDPVNAFDKTPLMYAAQFDLPRAAAVLLDHGADPNARTRTFWGCRITVEIGDRTPLMYAAENASPAMIRLLVERGGDRSAVDSDGRDVLDYLARNQRLSPAEREEARRLIDG